MYRQFDENIVTRESQEPNSVIPPRNNGLVFANSVFKVTSQKITANNKNQLYKSHKRYRKYKNTTDSNYYF